MSQRKKGKTRKKAKNDDKKLDTDDFESALKEIK